MNEKALPSELNAGDTFTLGSDEIDFDENDKQRTTPAGAVWKVESVEFNGNGNGDRQYSVVCEQTGASAFMTDEDLRAAGAVLCEVPKSSSLEELPRSAPRYVEIIVPSSFNDETDTIFDALEQGAEIGHLQEVSRATLEGRQDAAKLFFAELLDSVESLGAIAEQHGLNTLTDLMYLQNAILSESAIETWPGESKVCELIGELPSAKRWLAYTDLSETWKQHCVRIDQVDPAPQQPS
jgi:hypothetical protein